ncbi:HAAS signaling domain-containing protein [Chitinophaga nivalis]|uniref:DUF1700 domain-containing protein n=1 Tax=Chitinophaga nivalis TaxID=2991709 RepID=A0ABT3IMZ1_9BACT|nr:hypothetical protein [Chitinophaga nivalis]MCW3464984.1 hypothetical protein [Chitinophaga nivalis]MCW3485324.1 hypothetical protein [Chitinophaga nivalis]
MKTANISFNQEASGRIYQDYMQRVRKATHSLSKANQDDIYMELNSHIFEAMQQKNTVHEIDGLLDILEKLGAPEEVLKPLVADKKLAQATTTFNPVHVFKALVLNFTNGISYIIFFILYLLLFGFIFLIFAKIIHPAEVGLFYKDTTFMVLGMLKGTHPPGVRELLGNWFIPVMLSATILFYLLITFFLKLKKRINQR